MSLVIDISLGECSGNCYTSQQGAGHSKHQAVSIFFAQSAVHSMPAAEYVLLAAPAAHSIPGPLSVPGCVPCCSEAGVKTPGACAASCRT